jgi:hypothetical protein
MAGLGVAEPPPGQTGWSATPTYFFFFFWIFFKKKLKYVMGAFWEKKIQNGQIATI